MTQKCQTKGCGVYIYHDPESFQTYVGSSGDVECRKKTHDYLLATGRHVNKRFQQAFDQGAKFEFESMPCEDREQAFQLEQSILDEFSSSELLLNRSRSAKQCIVTHTPETKEKIRQALTGRTQSPETVAKRTGVTPSAEIVERRAEGLRSYYAQNPDVRERVRQQMLSRPVSEETKVKISASKIGCTHSQESRQKISTRKSVPVSVSGMVYKSGKEAAEALGIAHSTLQRRLQSNTAQFADWTYAK